MLLQGRIPVVDLRLSGVRAKLQSESECRMRLQRDPGTDLDTEARRATKCDKSEYPLVRATGEMAVRSIAKEGKPNESRLVPDASLR